MWEVGGFGARPVGGVAVRRPKFPELESLVHHPMDYARVVQKIGNEMDMTLIDLEDILPQVSVLSPAPRSIHSALQLILSVTKSPCIHSTVVW